jgi:glyoxylase-like metal-dependent hydrolase (beta-lactamase superfamily II)
VREIVPDVYIMEDLRGANVYLLVSEEGLTLVDSGLPGDAERILEQVRNADYALSDLRRIVVTHGHGDHVGGLAALAARTNAEVVAHRAAVPYVKQTRSLPAKSVVQRLLNWVSHRIVLSAEPCEVDREVEDGDRIKGLGGLRVIHVPGHTPGSIALFQPERGILFCGDALFNANPLGGEPGLRLPIRLFTLDREKARHAAARLAELPVEALCCGHGNPILKGARARIEALV